MPDLGINVRTSLIRVQQAWHDGLLPWALLATSLAAFLGVIAVTTQLLQEQGRSLTDLESQQQQLSRALSEEVKPSIARSGPAGPAVLVSSSDRIQSLLLTAASESGCRLAVLTTKDEPSVGTAVRKLHLDLQLSGSYGQTKAVISRLLAAEPSAVIEQITWSTGTAGGVEMAIQVTVHVVGDPKRGAKDAQ